MSMSAEFAEPVLNTGYLINDADLGRAMSGELLPAARLNELVPSHEDSPVMTLELGAWLRGDGRFSTVANRAGVLAIHSLAILEGEFMTADEIGSVAERYERFVTRERMDDPIAYMDDLMTRLNDTAQGTVLHKRYLDGVSAYCLADVSFKDNRSALWQSEVTHAEETQFRSLLESTIGARRRLYWAPAETISEPPPVPPVQAESKATLVAASRPAPARLSASKGRNPAASRDMTVRPSNVNNGDWRHKAACRDEDLELFFPVSEVGAAADLQIAQAKAVCGRCIVAGECLQLAFDTGSEGIFGGTTTSERQKRRQREATKRLREAES